MSDTLRDDLLAISGIGDARADEIEAVIEAHTPGVDVEEIDRIREHVIRADERPVLAFLDRLEEGAV